jgi:hypothetical protein
MKLIHALLTLGILVLAGCSALNLSNPSNVVNYKTGTSGLELELLQNLPPKQMIEGSPFRIAVKIQNRGAYDSRKGNIQIIGLSEAWTPLTFPEIQLPPLTGRSLEAPEGEIFVAEFTGRNIALPARVSDYRSKFWAVAQYDYETVAQANVCINSEILELANSPESCKPTGRISLGSQGAPITISKVEQVITPIDSTALIEYTFTIENNGNGYLNSPITFQEARLANRRMTCTPKTLEPEDLEDKRNQVTCRVSEPISSPYTTTISAALDYTYSTIEKGEFVIRRIPKR